MNENEKRMVKMEKLVKICICVALICITCIISGCYSTNTPLLPVTSNAQQRNDIGVENVYLSEKPEKSDVHSCFI